MNRRVLGACLAGTLLSALGWTALRAQELTAQKVAVHALAEIARKNPIDPAVGRAITTVESGRHSTVTVWQFKTGIAPHYHREHDEVIYCERGEGLARIGTETVRMKAGDFVVIPPGVPHGVTVTGREPMRGLSVFSPPFDGKDRIPVETDRKP
jgi:quercetin dioxygenase-like cupin family protein